MLRSTFAVLASLSLLSGCVDTSPPIDVDGAGGESGTGGGAADGPGATACGGELASMTERVVLAYLPTWSDIPALTETMDYSVLTHINLAFANPVEGGPVGFAYTDDAVIHALVARAHENGVKVIASIAGAAESDIVRARITEENTEAYIDELEALMAKFELDGIDVDIEGGSVDGTYAPFVQRLAQRIRPQGKLVTSAVAAWFSAEIKDDALFCFDFINVMSYDLLEWAGSPQPGDHASMDEARDDLRYWTLSRGYPAERTVLGVPFYGYCWGTGCGGTGGGGQIRYSAIAERFPEAVGQDWYEDSARDLRISLNSATTITAKTQLSQEYGGVMIWDISQDDASETLFDALTAGL